MTITPYTKTYEKIKDIDQFFDYNSEKKEMLFNGESLTIYIPARYETYQLLELSDTVKTLAVFDMIINEKYQSGLMMLTSIEIEPDDVSKTMVGDLQFVVLTLSKGSRFICNTERIADGDIVYAIWMEFVTRGKLLYNIDYDTLATLFDQAKSMCDTNIDVDHVIFEVIYAQLSRDPDNLNIQYRHTDMTKDFKFISLRSVGYATQSTTSRLAGSYFAAALNSAIIQEVTEVTPLEVLLRA